MAKDAPILGPHDHLTAHHGPHFLPFPQEKWIWYHQKRVDCVDLWGAERSPRNVPFPVCGSGLIAEAKVQGADRFLHVRNGNADYNRKRADLQENCGLSGDDQSARNQK